MGKETNFYNTVFNNIEELEDFLTNKIEQIGDKSNIFIHHICPQNQEDRYNIGQNIIRMGFYVNQYSLSDTAKFLGDCTKTNGKAMTDYYFYEDTTPKELVVLTFPKVISLEGMKYELSTPEFDNSRHLAQSLLDNIKERYLPRECVLGHIHIDKKNNEFTFTESDLHYSINKESHKRINKYFKERIDLYNKKEISSFEKYYSDTEI